MLAPENLARPRPELWDSPPPSEHTDRFFEQPNPYCDAAGRRDPVNSGPTLLAIALVAVGSQTLPAYCRMRVNR